MPGLQKSSAADTSIKLCHGFFQMIFDWKYVLSMIIGIKTLCAGLASSFKKSVLKSPNTTKNTDVNFIQPSFRALETQKPKAVCLLQPWDESQAFISSSSAGPQPSFVTVTRLTCSLPQFPHLQEQVVITTSWVSNILPKIMFSEKPCIEIHERGSQRGCIKYLKTLIFCLFFSVWPHSESEQKVWIASYTSCPHMCVTVSIQL